MVGMVEGTLAPFFGTGGDLIEYFFDLWDLATVVFDLSGEETRGGWGETVHYSLLQRKI